MTAAQVGVAHQVEAFRIARPLKAGIAEIVLADELRIALSRKDCTHRAVDRRDGSLRRPGAVDDDQVAAGDDSNFLVVGRDEKVVDRTTQERWSLRVDMIRKFESIADGVEEWRGGVCGKLRGVEVGDFRRVREKKKKREIAATRPTVRRPMLPRSITVHFLSRAMPIDSG